MIVNDTQYAVVYNVILILIRSQKTYAVEALGRDSARTRPNNARAEPARLRPSLLPVRSRRRSTAHVLDISLARELAAQSGRAVGRFVASAPQK